MAIGGVAIWLAAPAGRRFTSWFATAAVVLALLDLIADVVHGPRSLGITYTLLGLAIAVAAGRMEGGALPWRSTGPGPDLEPTAPPAPLVPGAPGTPPSGAPTAPYAAPYTPPPTFAPEPPAPGPPAHPGAPSPWQEPPSGEAPPTSPSGWGPPG